MTIARDPAARLRDVALVCALTERTVQAIVADLESDGYLRRARDGRRNRYEISPGAMFRHPAEAGVEVAGLLALLTGAVPSGGSGDAVPSGGAGSDGGAVPSGSDGGASEVVGAEGAAGAMAGVGAEEGDDPGGFEPDSGDGDTTGGEPAWGVRAPSGPSAPARP
ncbi:hypothetical protein ACQKM2_04035 [Streptomyces sp. NPDC004126]|uniref:hypothetical protein n=1 Tax=Streptomyces sp. NPDC004126 TaxID=3390695 RepID=UPI003CFCD453